MLVWGKGKLPELYYFTILLFNYGVSYSMSFILGDFLSEQCVVGERALCGY